ncbi:MAG: 3-dehydroquinate synthase [Candidatus Omnitrophota bacterium]
MKTINVDLGKRSYKILVGAGIIEVLGRYLRALGAGDTACVVTNAKVRRFCGRAVSAALKKAGCGVYFHNIPDSELGKSWDCAAGIVNSLAERAGKGRVFVVSAGGGVAGDVSGFAASVYKRGVPFIQIPTTLLAQVDSAIGGKNGVDLQTGKNLAGTFYQPRIVISDINFLLSLDDRQINSGIGEVIKYGLIAEPGLLDFLEDNREAVLKRDKKALEFIVSRCSALKAAYVRRDEYDTGEIRMALNFGHTFGHALEAAGKFRRYNHGEAVGWGISCALRVSEKLGILEDYSVRRRAEALLRAYHLPVKVRGVDPLSLLAAFNKDKKFIGSMTRMVLLEGAGSIKVERNIPLCLIKEVLKEGKSGRL